MDNLKLERNFLRGEIDRLYDSFKNGDSISKESLEDKANRLFELDTEIKRLMMDESVSEEQLLQEFKEIEDYRDKVTATASAKVADHEMSEYASVAATGYVGAMHNKKKLPKLELFVFDGDLKNWIQFWGCFESIHVDLSLTDVDKFQYLLQATTGEAKNFLKKYPPSAENYGKAIKELTRRFARPSLLIDYYFREMIDLLIRELSSNKKSDLKTLYDQVTANLNNLESLGKVSKQYSAVLVPIIESIIPAKILEDWEEVTPSNFEHPSVDTTEDFQDSEKQLERLLKFLQQKVDTAEKVKRKKQGLGLDDQSIEKEITATASALANVSIPQEKPTITCLFCDKAHPSHDCITAQSMSVKERKAAVKKSGRCFVCLIGKHRKCRSFVKCIICGKRHYVLLCEKVSQIKKIETDTNNQGNPTVSTANNHGNQVVRTANNMNLYNATETIMKTLYVHVKPSDSSAGMKKARVFLDDGCQKSYILNSDARALNLTKVGTVTLNHILFGGIERMQRHDIYRVKIMPLNSNTVYEFELLGNDKMCDKAPRLHDPKILQKLQAEGIVLTDCRQQGNMDENISIMLGADIIPQIMTGKVVKINNFSCIETVLGWTIMGEQTVNNFSSVQTINALCLKNSVEVSDPWSLETIGIMDPAESQNKRVHNDEILDKFSKTVEVTEEGRYQVRLPWINEDWKPSNNFYAAQNRLNNLTKKLQYCGKFGIYNNEFQTWLNMGIIEIVNSREPSSEAAHYLPHRPVFKEESRTTKCRPVFDASCRDKDGISINSCLETGPNLLEALPKLLLKFRLKKHGVTADIKKAFLMIGLAEQDRDYLRFLWWTDNDAKEIQVYRHTRVVFGVSSSPFLLNATINHHLNSISGDFQDTASQMRNSFYVDNLVNSVDSIYGLDKFRSEAYDVMMKGQFELREWAHTTSKGSQQFRCCQEKACINSTQQKIITLLGVKWDCEADLLYCNVNSLTQFSNSSVITKRILLSETQKIFDPLGILSAVVLVPKIIIQKCWKKGLGWDEPVDEEMKREFINWTRKFHLMEQCTIPRWLIQLEGNVQHSLHVFCDASFVAFGMCIFLRSQVQEEVKMSLVMAKSRLSPTKGKITIARLELIAALLATRLSTTIVEVIPVGENIHFWTDSTIALHWIKGKGPWKKFVRNRVKEISTSTDKNKWRHVPGNMNPADVLSRGCSVEQLIQNEWLIGPQWLKEEEQTWPGNKNVLPEEKRELEAERVSCLLVQTKEMKKKVVPEIEKMVGYYSSYFKAVNAIAWIRRFSLLMKKIVLEKKIRNKISLNQRNNPSDINLLQEQKRILKSKYLLVREIKEAEITLLRYTQRGLAEHSELENFEIFEDKHGLLRLKTRLSLGNFNEEFKYPILLPYRNEVVYKLLSDLHIQNNHAGVQTTLAISREKFWIIKGRLLLKQIINRCVICRKQKGRKANTPTAPLPAERINDAKAFQISGVDLAGPLILTDKSKSWVVLFVCALYRAVHLELIQSLDTDGFIQALRRFIARRGRIDLFYCDNGTNFKGCHNKLKDLDWAEIMKFTSVRRIEWRFSPPVTPWWGGMFERFVRTIKDLLKRVLGKSSVNYEELYTILVDIEVTINRRPLTYVDDNPEELLPLCPQDFLQDLPSNETPDLDMIDSQNLNVRIRHIQNLRDSLRQRFQKEYIGQLVAQNKSTGNISKLKVGDVVLIGDGTNKRIKWPLGIIEEIMDGKDGHPRVAKIRTAKSKLTRHFKNLVPLEVSSKTFYKDSLKQTVGSTEDVQENVVETDVGTSSKLTKRTRSGKTY